MIGVLSRPVPIEEIVLLSGRVTCNGRVSYDIDFGMMSCLMSASRMRVSVDPGSFIG